MAWHLTVALKPNAGLSLRAVLPSIAFRSRKNVAPHFPHQAGHHLAASSKFLGPSGLKWRRLAIPLRGPTHSQLGPHVIVFSGWAPLEHSWAGDSRVTGHETV
jgi:hypothetical protein